MKLKPFFILCMLFGAFTFISCELTEETKEEQPTEIVPVYELSLHQLYLETEERYLKMKIDTLEEGSDAYHATKIALDSVQGNLTEIANVLSESPDKLIGAKGNEIFVEVKPMPIGPIGPDGPLPLPNPSPCNCTIPLNNLIVIIPEGLQYFELRIKKPQNKEVIGELSKTPEKLVSEQGLKFNAYQLDIPDNLGDKAIIEVTKHSNITGGMLTYRFMVKLPKK